jgi:hypothetical protein
MAQKQQEESNKYYKDPEYNSDDYYDYEYASRVNRFHRPIGVGYYDNYYTNMYTYNQNPMYYGTSIYSGYGWGMPSQQFSSISIGISSGYGYGGGWGYSPYGYNMYGSCYNGFGYYDPWCPNYMMYGGGFGYGYGYNNWGYMNGYNQGFNQGFYQGYNNAMYYNRYDVNSGYKSMLNAPRGVNTGGNGRGRSNPGEMMSGRDATQQKYLESVAEEQNKSPRFINTAGQRSTRYSETRNNPSAPAGTSRPQNNGSIDNGRQGRSSTPQERSTNRRNNRTDNGTYQQQRQQQQTMPQQRSSEPVISNPGRNSGGGGSSPRNSGGGSTRRPR